MSTKQGYVQQYLYYCFYLLMMYFVRSICDTKSAYYTVSTGTDLTGLRCLSDNIIFNRAVRFHTHSGVCEKLSAVWNANPSFDQGYSYTMIVSYEQPFREAVLETSHFPPNFVVGCHFDVIFKTPDFQPEWFNFRVVDWSDEVNTTFIQVHFRPSASQTAFRSAYFGNWSQDILTPNPITEVNTVYTASVYLYETYWSVFVDGNHLINFTHLHQFNGQQMVHFWSLEVLCQHIVFYVP